MPDTVEERRAAGREILGKVEDYRDTLDGLIADARDPNLEGIIQTHRDEIDAAAREYSDYLDRLDERYPPDPPPR